jgi:hypothetical protein
METESISASEAAVLDAIRRKRIAAIADVAVLSRLTPSEARSAVEKLQSRNLLEPVPPSFFRLTSGGEELTRTANFRPFAGRSSTETLDEAEVKSRLDEIVRQFS